MGEESLPASLEVIERKQRILKLDASSHIAHSDRIVILFHPDEWNWAAVMRAATGSTLKSNLMTMIELRGIQVKIVRSS